MLRATSYQISVLLNDNIQYIVPPYQRNYVWTMDKWDRLWNDIVEAAEYPERPEHFLGAIVIRQEPDEPGLPKQRTIVDGQQRLTTVQVILTVVRDLARQRNLPDLAEQAQSSMVNPTTLPEQQLKVITSLIDLDSFTRLVTAGPPAKSKDDPPLAQAYRRFHDLMSKYVESSANPSETLAVILRTVSLRLYFVLMTLTEADDEQAIYERLNSLGEHLRKSELIRNHVLHRRWKRDLIPPRATYEDYWVHVNELPPTKVDEFLRGYLIIQRDKRRRITDDRLFIEFRDYVAEHEHNLTDLLQEIVRAAGVYRSIVTGTGLVGYERRFAAHLAAMNTYAFVPVLMRLFLSYDPTERGRALAVLDSYLIRRYVCRKSTNPYTAMVPEMLRVLSQGGDPAAGLRTLLSGQDGGRAWPEDDEVRMAIRTWDTRGPGNRAGNKHVAKELILLAEVQLSTSHIERLDFHPSTLTVEHLMPQRWKDVEWSVDAPTAELAARERQEREWAIHTLGNLTLITEDLNSFLGDKPWADKHPHLVKSRLQINRELPGDFASVADIAVRGERLAGLICTILPAPDSTATSQALAAMPGDLVDEPVEAFEENEEIEDLEALGERDELEDFDDDEKADLADARPNGGGDPAAPSVRATTARGRQIAPVNTGLSHNKRVLAALEAADGGPLTFREIAAVTALKTGQVKYYLKIRSIPGVDTTTKDGIVAGVLKRTS
jgi:Protein of unknown function DUF262/Protein of unknown function (DUF1524)